MKTTKYDVLCLTWLAHYKFLARLAPIICFGEGMLFSTFVKNL